MDAIFNRSPESASGITGLFVNGLDPTLQLNVASRMDHSYLVRRRRDVLHVSSCRGDLVVTRGDDTAMWSHVAVTALPLLPPELLFVSTE